MKVNSHTIIELPKPLDFKTATDEEVFEAMKTAPNFIQKIFEQLSEDLANYLLSENFEYDGVFIVRPSIYDGLDMGSFSEFDCHDGKISTKIKGKTYLAIKGLIAYTDKEENISFEEKALYLNKECFKEYQKDNI